MWIEIISIDLAPPLRHFLLRASGEHAYILYIYIYVYMYIYMHTH